MAISLGRMLVPSPTIVIYLIRTYGTVPLKKDHIGSVISEILRYRKTHTNKNLLLLYKDLKVTVGHPLVVNQDDRI